MRRGIATLTLAVTCGLLHAQTPTKGIAGTWRVEGTDAPFPWEAVLVVDGVNVIGAVSTASTRIPAEIFDGSIDGDTISFRFNIGPRAVRLTGVVKGDAIEFAWESETRPGFQTPNPDDRMFGTAAPRQFRAVRAPDATDEIADAAARARRSPAVTFEQILNAGKQPQNWLTYSGTLDGRRYSPLTEITPRNVNQLQMSWIWQAERLEGTQEATPIVVDGTMYTVVAPNVAVALNAATGQLLWTHSHIPKGFTMGYGTNRGMAILGSKLFMGTLDADLLALDAYSGKVIWDTPVADAASPSCETSRCYSISHAPLVVKNTVIVGTNGGEGKIRGSIAAFNADSGKEIWRFATIPGPGEPGHETWSGDAWKIGGGPVWNTGTYDPDLNLTYWGIGNPAPFDGRERPGDNLYTESVVALDPETGRLKWHYQFTPHDEADWDATQVPVLADLEWQGRVRKVMLFANRNGLFYVLDRATGAFLLGKPFVEVNWMTGFDAAGRPVRTTQPLNTGFTSDGRMRPNTQGPAVALKPGVGELGATNWYPPSYSVSTGLFYVPAWESTANPRFGVLRALDPRTGELRWEFKKESAIFKAGALSTASGLVFTGVLGQYASGAAVDGQFFALDALTGERLWQITLPDSVQAGPISYAVDGKQYIAVMAGNTLFSFALRP